MPNANSTNTPTLAAVINYMIDSRMRNTGVSLPGTIVSYDEGSQTCAVKPGVHRLVPSREEDGEDEVEVLPTLQGVPVCWLVGRGIQVKASLQAGDSVLLICLDRDADGWLDTGSPAEPGDARTHSWNAAVAIPGLVPSTSPFPVPSDAAALASKLDAMFRLLALGVPAAVPATNPASTMALVNLILGAIQTVYSTQLATVASDVLLLDS